MAQEKHIAEVARREVQVKLLDQDDIGEGQQRVYREKWKDKDSDNYSFRLVYLVWDFLH